MDAPTTWWLYLLRCADGRTYAGIAIDVQRRFELHCEGKAAKFTRANRPIEILGAQPFESRSAALKAEAALKKLTREKKVLWAEAWQERPPNSLSQRWPLLRRLRR